MRRRDLIALATTAAVSVAASPAPARSGGGGDAEEGTPSLNIAGVGLPIISDGRLRNYVFVTVRVSLGDGQTPETMRAKDPFIRDALVRTAHRVSLAVPGDWTRLNENAINAAVVAIAGVVAGHGAVTACEVVTQTPRRRTGLRQG